MAFSYLNIIKGSKRTAGSYLYLLDKGLLDPNVIYRVGNGKTYASSTKIETFVGSEPYSPIVDVTQDAVESVLTKSSIENVLTGLISTHTHIPLNDLFDGNRSVKRAIPGIQGVTPGGSTTVDFLNNVFYPAIRSVVNLSQPSPNVFEVGTSNNITVTFNITKNDDTLSSGVITKNSGTPTQLAVIPPTVSTVFSAVDTGVTVNTTYYATASVTNATLGSANLPTNVVGVNFYYPFITGISIVNSWSAGTSLYVATLNHFIGAKTDRVINYVPNNQYLVYAYPASYGNLSSITDPNGFSALSSFVKSNVLVSSLGLSNNWNSISYNVYTSTSLISSSAAGNFTFKF